MTITPSARFRLANSGLEYRVSLNRKAFRRALSEQAMFALPLAFLLHYIDHQRPVNNRLSVQWTISVITLPRVPLGYFTPR